MNPLLILLCLCTQIVYCTRETSSYRNYSYEYSILRKKTRLNSRLWDVDGSGHWVSNKKPKQKPTQGHKKKQRAMVLNSIKIDF